MTPAELADAILLAVRDAVAANELPAEVVDAPLDIKVERPRQKEHGDYATSIALVISKTAGKSPRAVAVALQARLSTVAGIESVDIAGPGFLNIRLEAAAQGQLAKAIVTTGATYGTGDTLKGRVINLEFISANPTGPLHLGHARWAAVGDALGRVLSAAGADVTREFYVNDAGVQMDRFGASLMAIARGEAVPEDGYHGAYIPELSAQIVKENPAIMELSGVDQLQAFRDAGYTLQLKQQQDILSQFGTHFDVWFSETTLHNSGAVDAAIEKLREQGHVDDKDGAVWLRTTDFGDDKDRVMIKNDGEKTYFAADAAYYLNKRERGFQQCIYMLGADHHGYVQRLRAIAACAGDNPDQSIDVLIGQLVKIVEDGQEMRLSKRAGNIITLEDLVEWVGVDAARYSLARSSADTPLTLDTKILTSRTNDNPVFTVQYAHARISSVLRNAVELKILADGDIAVALEQAGGFDPALLTHEREGDLLGALAEFPRVVASAAELSEPHRVARYLEELAGTYHRFYDACRVLPHGDEDVTDLVRARLHLCAATRVVVANGLALLGVSAPERM
ncbi:MAG: arginine--tRNA ligase [Actinobacteria bacterium]|uniref:arginine--tRNA ligase n=1 Tax=freshwater metagenome TaxID=449393 RepID=A0A6J6XAG4_9ZZZZ|nr:arginine--tRNA ligase [Actinomycetota bacterium]